MMTDGNSVMMSTPNGLLDKSKELQKEILMEKLRSKTSQYKNLAETSKGVRMTMLVSFDCLHICAVYFNKIFQVIFSNH